MTSSPATTRAPAFSGPHDKAVTTPGVGFDTVKLEKGIAMSKLKLAILAVSLAASSVALAQKAKYGAGRNDGLKVDVKLSERSKPIQQKAPDPKDQQPTLTAEDVLSIEGLV